MHVCIYVCVCASITVNSHIQHCIIAKSIWVYACIYSKPSVLECMYVCTLTSSAARKDSSSRILRRSTERTTNSTASSGTACTAWRVTYSHPAYTGIHDMTWHDMTWRLHLMVPERINKKYPYIQYMHTYTPTHTFSSPRCSAMLTAREYSCLATAALVRTYIHIGSRHIAVREIRATEHASAHLHRLWGQVDIQIGRREQ